MNDACNGCLSAVRRMLMRSRRAQLRLACWHLALPLLLARRAQAQRCAGVLCSDNFLCCSWPIDFKCPWQLAGVHALHTPISRAQQARVGGRRNETEGAARTGGGAAAGAAGAEVRSARCEVHGQLCLRLACTEAA